MKLKILISAMALAFGGAAAAGDAEMKTSAGANAQVETELGSPEVNQQGPEGGPAPSAAKPDLELGSPDVQAQGPEGKPAEVQVEQQLGQDETRTVQPVEGQATASADFSTLDKNGDGYISMDELNDKDRNNLAAADANADGRIDQAEFSAFEANIEADVEAETKTGTPSHDMGESGRAMDKMEKPE